MVFTRNAASLNRYKLSNLAPSNVDGGIITISQDHYARSKWRFPHVFHFPDVEESLISVPLKVLIGEDPKRPWNL